MIVDVTGTVLTPGNQGNDCLGNGEHTEMECCCDECDYMMCCLQIHDDDACLTSEDRNCPRSGNCEG